MFSLILPTYNPGPGIDRTLYRVRDFLAEETREWEVLFVLDGCADGTAERLEQQLEQSPEPAIRVLELSPNRGKGHAVQQGMLAARGTYRIFTDVDLAYGWEDVRHLADVLVAGAPAVIAAREHPQSVMMLPPHLIGYAFRRRLQSLLFSKLTRTLLP
ncbi:MAG: glycosyltransferase family 2 protein, partial [Gemmataceae bacterium]